jgi:2-dehydro-3-deoxy-D-arabinonate dehydratase
MTAIQHLSLDGAPTWVVIDDGGAHLLGCSLAELLGDPAQVRSRVEAALAGPVVAVDGAVALPPVDVQEVWAAGVTYSRSRDGRMEEATDASPYDRVYDAERPEMFLKATAERVVADGADVGIRADSGWDVPEPELGLVLDAAGGIVGYVVGNDMSSRSIEGENMLYLPQAKFYDAACALGSSIVPAWEVEASDLAISLTIARDGVDVFTGATSTSQLHRRLEDLAAWLYRGLSFPRGAVLLTGTGIVPEGEFTLREGDMVTIEIDMVGTLQNRVVVVGTGVPDAV